jgi:hypothetical protein
MLASLCFQMTPRPEKPTRETARLPPPPKTNMYSKLKNPNVISR